MDEYKSNSHRSKEAALASRERKVEKVVTSPVRTKQKTGVQKLADLLLPEDVDSMKSYLIKGILIPAGKKVFSEIIDTFLYGSSGNTRKNTPASKVSYRSYYDQQNDRNDRRDTVVSPKPKTGFKYDEVVFDNRGEAEDVLSRMEEVIATYGMVSVGDFYDMVGIVDENYTNEKYGWVNLHTASVIRLPRDGYMIKLPKALPLD